jgi:very-short-patch-repair endonuclease
MARRRTQIEQLVADALRPCGYPVKEQYKCGPYWLDFLVGWRLVVEADGTPWHSPERDARRDAFLRNRGYEIVHVPQETVLSLSPLALIDYLDHRIRALEHFARFP